MSVEKLVNPPLQEVVFEAHWMLRDEESDERIVDKQFKYALGLFTQKIANDFPVRKETNLGLDEDFQIAIPYTQYWKDELTLPVVQFGPGTLSFHSGGQDYSWEEYYRVQLIRVLEALQESYKLDKLQFSTITLLYINALDLPENQQDTLLFAQKELNTTFESSAALPGKRKGFSLDQINELEDGSQVRLIVRSGVNKNTGAKAIIWEIGVRCDNPITFPELASWLDMAHNHVSKLFRDILNPNLYASFDK